MRMTRSFSRSSSNKVTLTAPSSLLLQLSEWVGDVTDSTDAASRTVMENEFTPGPPARFTSSTSAAGPLWAVASLCMGARGSLDPAGVYLGLSETGRVNRIPPSASIGSSPTSRSWTSAPFSGGRFPRLTLNTSPLFSSPNAAVCPLAMASS